MDLERVARSKNLCARAIHYEYVSFESVLSSVLSLCSQDSTKGPRAVLAIGPGMCNVLLLLPVKSTHHKVVVAPIKLVDEVTRKLALL